MMLMSYRAGVEKKAKDSEERRQRSNRNSAECAYSEIQTGGKRLRIPRRDLLAMLTVTSPVIVSCETQLSPIHRPPNNFVSLPLLLSSLSYFSASHSFASSGSSEYPRFPSFLPSFLLLVLVLLFLHHHHHHHHHHQCLHLFQITTPSSSVLLLFHSPCLLPGVLLQTCTFS